MLTKMNDTEATFIIFVLQNLLIERFSIASPENGIWQKPGTHQAEPPSPILGLRDKPFPE